MTTQRQFDVAILGTGLGGTVVGAALARQGARVLLVESSAHPRFAIGESTIPETTIQFRILAERYGVPELANLSNFQSLRSRVSAACGVKRNFSFAYHRPGEAHRGAETTQFPTWAPPFGPDVHYYRQDVDAYMLTVAIRYGAVVRQQLRISQLDIDDRGVRLLSAEGEEFTARFVVDAGGVQAPVARRLGLRTEPCPLRTRSRTIYTHMTGVLPYDRCGPSQGEHRMPSPLSQGTLHHLFPGGWIWVIPFDNHPASTSRLCSVGLTLDLTDAPAALADPETEFRTRIATMPSVARQFADARAVRSWTGTGRLQYSSVRTAGARYALLPHAAAFVDPLFSSGLSVTMNLANVLIARILGALADDGFSDERFAYLDTWTRRCYDYYDRLVAGSYISFRSFELWNAWNRIWMLGSLYGIGGPFEVHSGYGRTGDPAFFDLLEHKPYRGVQGVDFDEFVALFEAVYARMEAVRDGLSAPGEAAGQIVALLARSGLCPTHWRLTDLGHRCPGTFTMLPIVQLMLWGRYRSPAAVRKHFFLAGRAGGLLQDAVRTNAAELWRLGRIAGGALRDTVSSWNSDWKRGEER